MSWMLPFAFAFVQLLRLGLMLLNFRYVQRHGAEAPSAFVGQLQRETLERSQRYSADKLRFGIWRNAISAFVIGGLLFGGGLEAYDHAVSRLHLGFIAQGLVFFLLLFLLGTIADLPFALYSTFRLEERHGFNRMSLGLFIADACKATLLGVLLTSLLAGGGFWLVHAAPSLWWLWAFIGYAAVSVAIVLLAPYVIEPLFFKTRPLDIEELRDEIRALSQRAGVPVRQVLEMDASRRSTHSNAYFTGFGRVKRVVLFDTLKRQLGKNEVLAILAHELGHWKLRHVSKRFFVSLLMALAGLYFTYFLVTQSWALSWLHQPSFSARVVVAGVVVSLLTFPLIPLFSRWSRAHEWQADAFAASLTGQPGALASALLKLASDNLSAVRGHPLYEAFYYSHPPISERIARWHAAGEGARSNPQP